MSTILHLMGPSCAGKSTLIKRLLALEPQKIGAVEVGKILTAKYGEAYFKGQAAPEKTQKEAWDIYTESVEEFAKQGKRLILVDGQPRDLLQAQQVEGLWRHPHNACFALIHASHDVRESRCRADRSRDVKARLKRISNDYRNCYTVMAELLRQNQVIRVFDTSDMRDAAALAEQIIAEYML